MIAAVYMSVNHCHMISSSRWVGSILVTVLALRFYCVCCLYFSRIFERRRILAQVSRTLSNRLSPYFPLHLSSLAYHSFQSCPVNPLPSYLHLFSSPLLSVAIIMAKLGLGCDSSGREALNRPIVEWDHMWLKFHNPEFGRVAAEHRINHLWKLVKRVVFLWSLSLSYLKPGPHWRKFMRICRYLQN